MRARSGEAQLSHLAKDVQTALACLFQSFAHEFRRNAADLDIHLEGCDTFGSTRHLEVHIAEVVFRTGDVGQDLDLAAFLDGTLFGDEAHGDTCDRSLDRNASVHQTEAATANRGHGRRTVGFLNFGNHADGVREVFRQRKNGSERTFGEMAVTDFAAAHAEALAFTHAVRREIVMQHVALGAFALQAFVALFVGLGAERADHETLGFATLEDCRTVSARENAEFDFDRADFGRRTAVEAHVFVQDHFAHGCAFVVAEDCLSVGNESRILFFVLADDGENAFVFEHLRAEVCHSRIEVGLHHVGVDVLVQFVPHDFLHRGEKLFVGFANVLRLEFHLRLSAAVHQFLLGLAHELDGFVTGENCVDHRVFGHFVGTAFHHADGIFGTGDHQVQIGAGHLFVGGHHDVLTIDHGHAYGGNLLFEGQFRKTDRKGCCRHAEHVRCKLAVSRQNLHDHLDFAREVLGEHRANRAVNNTCRKRFFVRGTTGFALAVAAREATSGVSLFAVFHSEGEEVTFFFFAVADGREHESVAHLGDGCSASLLGDTARFERDDTTVRKRYRHFLGVQHLAVFLMVCVNRHKFLQLEELAAQTEFLDQGTLGDNVLFAVVLEEVLALRNHHGQTAQGVEVLLVGLCMFGEVLDLLGEESDLNADVTGVLFVCSELSGDFCSLFFSDSSHYSHSFFLLFWRSPPW